MLLHVIQKVRTVLTAGNSAYTVAALVLSLASIIVGLLWTTPSFKTWRQLRNLRRVKPKKKNMKDQYDDKYAIPEGTPTDGPVTIKAIFIHPIKSCAPVEVDKAVVTKAGLLYDRCFAFAVDAEDKKSDEKKSTLQFISQRTKPKMSLIHTELWLPREGGDVKDPLVHAGGALRITFPDPERPTLTRRLQACLEQLRWNATPRYSFVVPLTPTIRYLRESDLQPRPFTIHSREAQGVDMGRLAAVAAAVPRLKALLGYPDRRTLTLLRCTPDTLTRTDRNLAPLARIGSRAVHGYTDQQPVNVNSVASVHAVSRLLPRENRPLDALRFRANLWIAGAAAYDEESWKRCRVVPRQRRREGAKLATTLSVVCRTSRCTMPNVDPESGTFSAERPAEGKKKGLPQPTTALVRHRMVESGNGAALGYLGMHAVPEDRDLDAAREGLVNLEICVGDEVEVLERGEHLYGSTGDLY
ncbi:MOSC, beta barrel [Cordyceps fumosorosea ARSEF 2679]|uniref:MOSC, beta barrel n=1 Tax=Cordyceps fumosorosea (strain ARSEF 2679) TaxID=1081104 RepID=A0A162JR65_CORFA|nr:MOSC, beta barrel [Cordyceps fumosorosea ARSEF 2679]OAA72592.1 MOSC, beta barrel [Cordyceps fumosorosea ARSEF 2679]